MREKSLLTLLRISSHEKEGLEAPLPSCVGVGPCEGTAKSAMLSQVSLASS